jgi:RES domain-containing protein
VKIGAEWLSSMRSAVLLVPSVIVPEESAALVNTRHPEAQGLRAGIVRRFEYNRLFRSG